MNHLTIQQVSASLDGALDGVSLELVVRHLGSCRDCRDRHARLSKQDDAMRRMLAFEPTELAMSDAVARVDAVLAAEVRGDTQPMVLAVQAPVHAPVARLALVPPIERIIHLPLLAQMPHERDHAPAPRAARQPFRLPRHAARVSAVLGVLALLITAVSLLPPVIHITLPALPQPRLPRLEVVQARPAAVPHNSVKAPAPKRVVATPTPAPTAPSPAPAVLMVAPVAAATRVEPNARAATPFIESADNDSAAWPLLCGVVLDASGVPVAGARVSLADLDLAGRTDKRGHFCLAAPPGERTLSVSAQGFATTRKLVALEAQGLDLSITLADHE